MEQHYVEKFSRFQSVGKPIYLGMGKDGSALGTDLIGDIPLVWESLRKALLELLTHTDCC